MPRKKSPTTKRRGAQYSDFLLEIGRWSLPYSYSVNSDGKLARGPYWEHLALVIAGSIVYPKKYAGSEVEIYIIGSREEVRLLNAREDLGEWTPECVGTLTLRGSQRQYLGSLPLDVVWPLGSMLQAGAYRYVCLHGEAMVRGRAKINSIQFERTVDPDNYPKN